MTSIEQKVRGWPEWWRIRFVEVSGSHMNDGASQAVADQRAYLALRDEAGRALNGEGA